MWNYCCISVSNLVLERLTYCLSNIFSSYILEEITPKPKLPPYFDLDFLSSIKTAKEEGYDISSMSVKQWTCFLFDQEFTFQDEGERVFFPCKAEIKNPLLDWKTACRNSRLPSLDFHRTSFSFKLLHNLLTTEYRVSTIMPNSSPYCKFGCGNIHSDQLHVFFHCRLSYETGNWLLHLVRKLDPSADTERILKLDLNCDDAIFWIIITTLHSIWESRSKMRRLTVPEAKAILLTEVNVLHQTRFKNIAEAALLHISM